MKKLVIFLSIALVVSFAVPAFSGFCTYDLYTVNGNRQNPVYYENNIYDTIDYSIYTETNGGLAAAEVSYGSSRGYANCDYTSSPQSDEGSFYVGNRATIGLLCDPWVGLAYYAWVTVDCEW